MEKQKRGVKPKEDRDQIKERLTIFVEKWKSKKLGKDQAKKIAYTAISNACKENQLKTN
jgi:hypothetical protein